MSLFEERAARNEAFFRELNEHVGALAEARDDREAEFVCECSDTDCMGRITISLRAYEAVRAHARRFVVQPGHEGGFEHVVEHHGCYAVVEKEGAAARVAERNDPRG